MHCSGRIVIWCRIENGNILPLFEFFRPKQMYYVLKLQYSIQYTTMGPYKVLVSLAYDKE